MFDALKEKALDEVRVEIEEKAAARFRELAEAEVAAAVEEVAGANAALESAEAKLSAVRADFEAHFPSVVVDEAPAEVVEEAPQG